MTPAPPASPSERYAAWSLDAVAVGALAAALTWTRLVDAWHAGVTATTALMSLLRERVLDGLGNGASADNLTTALLHDPAVSAAAAAVQSAFGSLLLTWLLAYAVVAAIWHVGGERSRWLGSPGKRALGLRVVAADGDHRPAAWQTLVRHFGGALSWLTLNLGHALALVPPQRRALHDYLAQVRVVSGAEGHRLPAWARAWLWLQLALVVLAMAWLVLRDLAAMRGALAA